MNTHACISKNACVCMHTHAHAHAHTHTHTHTHKRTHAYIHTHTSAYLTEPSVKDLRSAFTAALKIFLLWLFCTCI